MAAVARRARTCGNGSAESRAPSNRRRAFEGRDLRSALASSLAMPRVRRRRRDNGCEKRRRVGQSRRLRIAREEQIIPSIAREAGRRDLLQSAARIPPPLPSPFRPIVASRLSVNGMRGVARCV